jgi:hypothetical protein
MKLDRLLVKLGQKGLRVDVVAGENLLSSRSAGHATIPNPQPWDDDRKLTILDLRMDTHRKLLENLAGLPSPCLLVHGVTADDGTWETQLNTIAATVEKISGFLLWWQDDSLSLHEVVTLIQKEISSATKGRTTSPAATELGKILHALNENNRGQIKILSGSGLVASKEIIVALAPRKLPGETTNSLLLIDIRCHRTLRLVTTMAKRTVLVVGEDKTETPGGSPPDYLKLARQETEKNSGILLRIHQDYNLVHVKDVCSRFLRRYNDQLSLDQSGGRDDDDNRELHESLADDNAPDPGDHLEQQNYLKKLKECLEKAFVSKEKGVRNCAALVTRFYELEQEFLEFRESHPDDAFFKNGTVKVTYIYQQMAIEQKAAEAAKNREIFDWEEISKTEQQRISKTEQQRLIDSVKKRFSRCREEDSRFRQFMDNCLGRGREE